MKVLIVGAGVIGTVFGAHLAASGLTVSVLRHGRRTDEIGESGLVAVDVLDGDRVAARVKVATTPRDDSYDMVLITVRWEQLSAALAELNGLAGRPRIVLFGNNPHGRAGLGLPGGTEVLLGFPGIGGRLLDGTAEYVRIREQPTALEASDDPRLAAFEAALVKRGFSVQRVRDMNGWLAYHSIFVACIAAALIRCSVDPVRLGRNRETLGLMCDAITEGFSALRGEGIAGLPANLAILHNRMLRRVAVLYWSRTMRSPKGELYFAAHTRHAEAEMRALGIEVLARVRGKPNVEALRRLLEQARS